MQPGIHTHTKKKEREFLLFPTAKSKQNQNGDMEQQEPNMEETIFKDLNWEESPVDCPFEEELAPNVK